MFVDKNKIGNSLKKCHAKGTCMYTNPMYRKIVERYNNLKKLSPEHSYKTTTGDYCVGFVTLQISLDVKFSQHTVRSV